MTSTRSSAWRMSLSTCLCCRGPEVVNANAYLLWLNVELTRKTQNIGYYVYIYIRICLNRTSFYRHVGVPFTICHQSMPCRWVPSLAAEVVEPWNAQWCQKGVWGRGHADLAFAFKGLATCCACFSGLCGRMSVSEWSL